jgi:hypothetical protein
MLGCVWLCVCACLFSAVPCVFCVSCPQSYLLQLIMQSQVGNMLQQRAPQMKHYTCFELFSILNGPYFSFDVCRNKNVS